MWLGAIFARWDRLLIANDIWLKSHPLPDDVIEQAIRTLSAAKQITLPTDEIPISKEDTLLQKLISPQSQIVRH